MNPILCNYYITYRCNARCQFCDIWSSSRYQNIGDSQLADVQHNLSQLKKIGVKFIDFTGGEPLLHRDLPAMLTCARQLGLFTSVTTNCALYPRIAQQLKGKVDLLHFSLDSLDDAAHDRLRGKALHRFVMQSIDLARALGEKPDLLYTVTDANINALASLSDFAVQQRLTLIVNPVFRYSHQRQLSGANLACLEKFKTKPYVYLNQALQKLIKAGGNDRRRPRCRAVSSSIVISPDNKLLLPCFHHAVQRINLNTDLIDIVKSETYRDMKRRQGRFSFCQHCTINCYFDPSFLYRFDRYFLLSLLSKVKYGFDKYVRC